MEGMVCRSCRLVIIKGDKCPLCGGTDLTSKWSGYAIILNSEKSDMARRLGVKVNSTFALNIKA